MPSAASVIICALALLGRSAQQFPPIVPVGVLPPGASVQVEGFVQRDPDVIYVVTSTPVFRAALKAGAEGKCRGREFLQKVASIIVHEEWHLLHGSDEQAAYEAQLTALLAMGSGPGSPLYYSVRRSMQSVLSAARRPAPVHPDALTARR